MGLDLFLFQKSGSAEIWSPIRGRTMNYHFFFRSVWLKLFLCFLSPLIAKCGFSNSEWGPYKCMYCLFWLRNSVLIEPTEMWKLVNWLGLIHYVTTEPLMHITFTSKLACLECMSYKPLKCSYTLNRGCFFSHPEKKAESVLTKFSKRKKFFHQTVFSFLIFSFFFLG